MANSQGDRFSISIGGDVSGTVVAGHRNHVEVGRDRLDAPATDAPAREDRAAGATQKNVAKDDASLYTVMNGELHIHNNNGGPAPQ
ncbi:hypothetical protein GQS52_08330 [Streptomyces sp. SCUT-3]|uniref:hypothetical protein n=1 Tax=Streptomyces sp. SCUT-3 TaxID=2684469 RepID=UPI000CA8FB75|nr:hypothetical protein [Streptomyces sp. SCUT-3]PLW71297.1 hypothetical protein C0036_18590 [Streptomyces sp. DJ]QMV21793.1 hypothetical protein GQS52_08330 [Streptomyces sp. SCUT-3]